MWMTDKRHKDDLENEKLNRFSDELLRAFEAGEAEINTAATSPFLYRRIRVRIEAEEKRLAEQRGAWQVLLTGVKRAIPVMAMLAIVTIATLIMRQSSEEPPSIMSDVFSFSQDELIASAAGIEPGQPRNGGGN